MLGFVFWLGDWLDPTLGGGGWGLRAWEAIAVYIWAGTLWSSVDISHL